MQAPVETPENRASVRTATCLPNERCFERRGDLVDLLHARPHRAAADQDQHVARPDRPIALPFDRGDGVALAGEDPRRAGLAIDAVGVDHGRVDRRALDHRALGGEVAAREGHGAGQPALPGAGRAHDHVVGVDAILLE